MKNPNPYSCDVCSTPKREVNHWWLGIACLISEKGALSGITMGYSVIKWDDIAADKPYVAHICGLECAGKWLLERLSTIDK